MNQESSQECELKVRKVNHVEVLADADTDIVEKDGYVHITQDNSNIFLSLDSIDDFIAGLQLIKKMTQKKTDEIFPTDSTD